LALTGCGDAAKLADENRRLREELKKASTALDERWMESHANLAHWRREATIAAACDYLIPICPESMTAPGHTAMQQGVYGGGGMLFWGLVSAKFAPMGAVLAALWLTLHIGFLRLIKPARKEIEEARAMIISAQIRDRLVREETREAQQQIEKIRQAIEQAEQAHQKALEAARRAQEQARQEQAALETIRQAREAIKGL
jgi:hypothetical protein